MNRPLVSVVIAAYNVEKYIETCITCIQNQTYDNWEIIVCNDASTDSTLDILTRLANDDTRIKIISSETNIFASGARNRCINEASGELIMIQDADDVCEPSRMEKLVDKYLETGCEIISSAHYLFDDNGKYHTHYPKEEFPTKKSFLSGMPFCHAASLIKKDALHAVGSYSKKTPRNEDYDMFMKLYAAGFKGCNIVDDALYGYRVDQNTLSRRTFAFRIDELKVRYSGYKALGILFPQGIIYCLKPILAYFVQIVRKR